MTLGEVIAKAPQYRPNNKAEDSDIIRWVNEVDSRVKTDIEDAYHFTRPFIPYTMATPATTVLRVEPPFDRVYEYWICASIDLLQGDYERYNESIQRFNNAFEEYSGYFARTRMPKHHRVRYF